MDVDQMARALVLDGNAVAGELRMIFGREMTTDDLECASCGQVHAFGTLLAFTQAPGIVLRCPGCEAVVLRVVETPRAIYVDARGAAVMMISRPADRT
jgi:hypothetical protein